MSIIAALPAPAHQFPAYHGGDGGGDDGDDPARRKKLPSTHQVDAPPVPSPTKKKPQRRPRPENAPKISLPCPVCGNTYWSHKALHGHMRIHPNRPFRGVLPPDQRPPKRTARDAAKDILDLAKGAPLNFQCNTCGRKFSSRQALGGHRASHQGVRGCYAKRNEVLNAGEILDAEENGGGRGVPDLNAKGKQVEEESQVRSSKRKAAVLIDLNLPAPLDSEEQEESSQELDLNRKQKEG